MGDDSNAHGLAVPRVCAREPLAREPVWSGRLKCGVGEAEGPRMTRAAIVQSNYLPWRGYFDLIRCSDAFVLLDCVQYTRRDWRNRNRIMIDGLPRWLTVPVQSKGQYEQRIDEARVTSGSWATQHRRSIQMAYAGAPGFAACFPSLDATLQRCGEIELLSEINRMLLAWACQMLGISTRLVQCPAWAAAVGNPTERLIRICQWLDVDEYLSGPAARGYLDEQRFCDAGISVAWATYDSYLPYQQRSDVFQGAVSIVDLLMMTGHEASSYLTDVGRSGRGEMAA